METLRPHRERPFRLQKIRIVEEHQTPGDKSEFISVADVSRATLNEHPWSIGGGGAAELKQLLEERCVAFLQDRAEAIGVMSVTGEDDVYAAGHERELVRAGLTSDDFRGLVVGDSVRDWSASSVVVIFPHREDGAYRELPRAEPRFWRYRALLRAGIYFGKIKEERGMDWREFAIVVRDKLRTLASIAFAEVSTHNHFAFDRGGKVFNRTAPVIKLPSGTSKSEYLVLLGQLNSSIAEFWMKQVYQPKGGDKMGDGGRVTGEGWEERYQRDGTKLKSFPVGVLQHPQLEAFAYALDAVARERNEDTAEACIQQHASAGAETLRSSFEVRRARDLERLFRMVGLQEELDWLCYRLYGIDPDGEVRSPEQVPPLGPGKRPFEISLAREDAERRGSLAQGEEPDEAPTEWFERHGWEPVTLLDSFPDSSGRHIFEARLARTAANRNLALVEQPTYKRRWYRPDHEKEERLALDTYLANRMEEWARGRNSPFTRRQLIAALQAEAGVLAAAECRAGRAQFDLEALLAERLMADTVPNNKHHVFKPSGLDKRAAWETTWALQRREDAGEKVTPPVPPKYASADFVRSEYWSLRGALDVPRERFVAFTEVPGRDGAELLYAWAGWTLRQRAKVLIELDEEAEGSGIPVADRYGLLYGAQFLVPYVAWESKDAAAEFDAVVKSLVGKDGVTDKMLAEWAERFPPPSPPRTPRTRRRTA